MSTDTPADNEGSEPLKPWWQDRDKVLEQFQIHGNSIDISRAHNGRPAASTIREWARRLDIPLVNKKQGYSLNDEEVDSLSYNARRLHTLLKGNRTGFNITHLANELDCSPRKVREAADELREYGFNIPDDIDADNGGRVSLDKVAPTKEALHRSILEGNTLRFGVVSDTHLGSKEEALEELHLAYDVFEEEGIQEVLHAGDWVDGVGIYGEAQHNDIFVHTFEDQVNYLVENYPEKRGMVTRGITGNHDVEGKFGRIGANPLRAAANRREDIHYLGNYEAYINFATQENPCYVHLLHGKGGMSYAYSYKAQKLVDGYPAGRKPAILIAGHWHVWGIFGPRGVKVMFPGCFQWQSDFLARIGLQPAIGFHIVNITIGDDGSVVKYVPEWFTFYEGRTVRSG